MISIDRFVEERNEEIKASREELQRERAEREAALREKKEQGLRLREEIEQRYLETKAWRQREIAARRAAAARAAVASEQERAREKAEAMAAKLGLGGPAPRSDDTAPQAAQNRPPAPETTGVGTGGPGRRDSRPKARRSERFRSPASPPAQPARVSAERAADIRVGDVVEVKKGFLKGRRGAVQEIDDKGAIKVAFGALSSRLTSDEVSGLGPTAAAPQPPDGGSRRQRRDNRRSRPRSHGVNDGKEKGDHGAREEGRDAGERRNISHPGKGDSK